MSINSALLAGVAGLEANTSALSSISQNIANVNTVGYKDSETSFNDLVTSANATGTYSAGGVSSVTTQSVTQQGSTTQTSSPTDLAINGQGMFVTTPAATAITAATPVLFTRAGSFTPDSAGYLKNAAGLYLQAWPANNTGVIQDNGASLNGLHPVNVNSIGGAVSPTTAVSINGNLNSSQAINAIVTAGNYSPTTTADSMTGGGVTPDVTMTVQVSDSQGGQHTLQYDFLKSSTPNQWYAEIQTVPTSDVTTSGTVPGQIAYGTVAFNSDGSINLADTSLPLTLSIGASSAGAGTAAAVNAPGSGGAPSSTPAGATNGAAWASSFGVSTQTITLNLNPSSSSSGLTQDSTASQQSSSPVNGTPYGTFSSVAIDSSGIITANFSTGATRVIGQVALATFPNANGLTPVSGDAYAASTTSGAYDLVAPGPNGSAKLAASALESSTVDLSSQFASLIVTQRAYSASSKIITTADSMIQDLLSIIR